MMDQINLPLIMLAALIAGISPGPATLTIAATSMNSGRKYGLALAAGITTGSWMWSISAALGLGAVMLANAWAFEVLRYFGACYLLYLAYKSARSAFSTTSGLVKHTHVKSLKAAYAKGLALHLTNPKAILFFGSLFSIGVPPGTPFAVLSVVVVVIGVQSLVMFLGYAVVFSSKPMVSAYQRMRRWLEGAFAIAFASAGLKILTARLN